MTNVFLSLFFQLTELEQRVMEAETRADDAEDKVRKKPNSKHIRRKGCCAKVSRQCAIFTFLKYGILETFKSLIHINAFKLNATCLMFH